MVNHRTQVDQRDKTCPIYQLFSLISKKRNIFILKLIGDKNDTFTGLKVALHDLNSSILTQRLDELIQSGLVSKVLLSQKPRIIRYHLTSIGYQVLKSLEPLEKVSQIIYKK